MQDPRHIEAAWGSVVIVRHDGSVSVLQEKALSAKLELLYSKSLFLVALNLAQSEEVSRLPSLHTVSRVQLSRQVLHIVVSLYIAVLLAKRLAHGKFMVLEHQALLSIGDLYVPLPNAYLFKKRAEQ